MLAGYLAAGVSQTGKIGTFGGLPIPPVVDFMKGLYAGIAYYNEENGTDVQLLGWDPADPDDGASWRPTRNNPWGDTNFGNQQGKAFFQEGVDIVLPVAGGTGIGTFTAAKQAQGEGQNVYAIGVDTDQYLTAAGFESRHPDLDPEGHRQGRRRRDQACRGRRCGWHRLRWHARERGVTHLARSTISRRSSPLTSRPASRPFGARSSTAPSPSSRTGSSSSYHSSQKFPRRLRRRGNSWSLTRTPRRLPVAYPLASPPRYIVDIEGWHVPMRLRLNGITKQFPGVLANDHVSIEVDRGEILALLGENGAGKTTLMNILSGLYKPDEGEILLDDQQRCFRDPAEAIEAGIGMVHQHFMLVPVFDVADSVTLGSEVTTGPSASSTARRPRARIVELSETYGLDVDPDAMIEDLPVGVRQRVEILKALYRKSDVLVLDEPSAVLTPSETDELFEIIRGAGQGAARP